jgi:hypothetical protein
MITDFAAKTLKIIKAQKGIHARELGDKLWPDSPAKRRSYNTGGYGACSGKGLWLSAGSYVAKLKKKKLVEDNDRYGLLPYKRPDGAEWGYFFDGYRITAAGKAALEEYESARSKEEARV